jgi:phage terminase large subunit GpA-like protein
MSELRTWLKGLMSQAFRPRPKGGIAKWGVENVVLSSEESSGAAGPYRPDMEPWTTILFDFAEDPRYDELFVLKGSRMGFTLAFFIVMLWWLAHYSTNIIFCIDNAKEVKKISRKRMIPLIKSVKALGDVIPANERAMTAETLFLKGRTVFMVGAQSVSQVTNKTASLVGADEVDQYEEFASGEANALEHLRDRVMDVPNSKGIYGGKPRNEEDILWQEYQTGTRHKLFVPCPHCGTMQILEFKQVRFEHCRDNDGGFDLARVMNETYYQCMNIECGTTAPHFGKIEERHKSGMLAAREWRQTNFGQDEHKPEPRKMSCHISQLYSPRPKLTWANIALHFIKANKKGGRFLAHFWRTRMGEPYREKRTIIKGEDVRKLGFKSGYKHNQCPVVPCYVAMQVDVQIDVKKWTKMAFEEDGTGYIIDYGQCLAFEDLYEEAYKPLEVLNWGGLQPEEIRVEHMWIDEGDGANSMKDVRDFCAKPESRGWVFPCKGAGGVQIRGVVDERDRDVDGYKFHAYHVSHDAFASELYLQRIGKNDEIVQAIEVKKKTGKSIPIPAPRLYLMEGADEEFIEELCQEKRVLKKVRGRLRWVWDEPAGDNDFGDCVKYGLAMWYVMRSAFSGGDGEDPSGEIDPENEEPKQPKQRDYTLHLSGR